MGKNQAIAPEDNYPLVRVNIGVRISFGVGRQFSSGAIVPEPVDTAAEVYLEPFQTYIYIYIYIYIYVGAFLKKVNGLRKKRYIIDN